jgi:hypothetical protein
VFLRDLRFKMDTSERCCICISSFGLDETVEVLPCNHAFHEQCLTSWLNLRDSCPVCRSTSF